VAGHARHRPDQRSQAQGHDQLGPACQYPASIEQGQPARPPAGHARGQAVTLQIKPHLGDTLRMRLDQQSEMTGVRRTKVGESSAMVATPSPTS